MVGVVARDIATKGLLHIQSSSYASQVEQLCQETITPTLDASVGDSPSDMPYEAPTPEPTPEPTYDAPGTGIVQADADDALTLRVAATFNDYFGAINSSDYSTAWNLLSGNEHKQTRKPGVLRAGPVEQFELPDRAAVCDGER